ncbi:hypothetical protein AB1Y20_010413 [Prymnesium parvum]|uniref:Uncharacterized protein n=1 Tax=Prymnesium parvum TaxID=97485 RepID=A0AB34IRW5_PRYPA
MATPSKVGDVYYFGDWKPKQGKIKEEDPDAPPSHYKISNYNVIINDSKQYTWMIRTAVTHPYNVEKMAFFHEASECEAKVEGQHLVIVKQGEQWGISLKLPKTVDLSATPFIAESAKHELFVTMPKIGAKEPPNNITEVKAEWGHPPSYYTPGVRRDD